MAGEHPAPWTAAIIEHEAATNSRRLIETEVHFTPEQEALITQTARANGSNAEKLVKDATLRFVDDANFRAAVLEAKAYADRGEFIEEEEMDARFEEMLKHWRLPERT